MLYLKCFKMSITCIIKIVIKLNYKYSPERLMVFVAYPGACEVVMQIHNCSDIWFDPCLVLLDIIFLLNV